jgi:hypothetical protein
MADIAKLRHALDQFDDTLDALWTPDTGLPRISAVRAIPGFEEVIRADIDATGRKRRTPAAPEAQPETVAQAEPEPEQVAQADLGAEPVAEVQAEPAPRDLPAECEAAEKAVIAARETLRLAKEHVSKKRGAFAVALRNWQNASGAPNDFAELHRRHVKADLERRAAIARGEIPPDSGPVSSVGPSRLDQTAAAMAGFKGPGGGNAFRRNATTQRGGFVPKVPSER